jgi:hypothetical protein
VPSVRLQTEQDEIFVYGREVQYDFGLVDYYEAIAMLNVSATSS